MAALRASDGSVTSFDAHLQRSGGHAEVHTLARLGTRVYLGGFFDTAGGAARRNLAAVDAASGAVAGWDPHADQNGFAASIETLVPAGDEIYAGGRFTAIGGQQRASVARLRTTDATATAWNPSANDVVHTIAVVGDTAYVGGSFTAAGGAARAGAAALATSDGHALAWDAQLEPFENDTTSVAALVVSGGTVYMAGRLTAARGQPRSRAAAVDASTATLRAWAPEPVVRPPGGGGIEALAAGGGRVLAGGSFSGVGAVPRASLAAVDLASGSLLSWSPAVDLGPGSPSSEPEVRALAVSGATLYVGGRFAGVTGAADCPNLAAIDRTSGSATGSCARPDGLVRALALDGARLYLGGDFEAVGNTSRSGIAALAVPALTLATWAPQPQYGLGAGRVHALAPGGGTVLAGGVFSSIGGQTRAGVAALSSTTGSATAWNAHLASTEGFTPAVNALLRSGSRVYIGGFGWNRLGGSAVRALAAADAATGAAVAWAPQASFAPDGNIVEPSVDALGAGSGVVFAAGGFDRLAEDREGAAAIRTDNAHAAPWAPRGLGFGARAVAVTASAVITGSRDIAIYRSHGPPVFRHPPRLLHATPFSYPAAAACLLGEVSGNRPFFAYRIDWLRDGVLLPHQEIETGYGVPPDDDGHLIACRMTVSNDEGTVSADSAAERTIPLPNRPPPAGSGGAGGGAGGAAAGGVARPRLNTLSFPARMRLGAFLKRGLRVRVVALRPLAALRLELSFAAPSRRHAKPRRLRRAKVVSFKRTGRRTVVLRAPRGARAALRGARKVRLIVRSTAVARDGTRGRSVTRGVTARR